MTLPPAAMEAEGCPRSPTAPRRANCRAACECARPCGEARGIAATGRVSVCCCSGLVCDRCGDGVRRPITDFYDPASRRWWHVPYFHQAGHRCALAPGEAPKGSGWTTLEPAPEVVAYQEALTRWTLEHMDPNAERDLVEGDRWVGRLRLGRSS